MHARKLTLGAAFRRAWFSAADLTAQHEAQHP